MPTRITAMVTQGIMAGNLFLWRGTLETKQSWGGTRDCGGQQHIAPTIVQYHVFFPFGTTCRGGCAKWS